MLPYVQTFEYIGPRTSHVSPLPRFLESIGLDPSGDTCPDYRAIAGLSLALTLLGATLIAVLVLTRDRGRADKTTEADWSVDKKLAHRSCFEKSNDCSFEVLCCERFNAVK